jgi:membrane associated rhomboid family serine protease
MIYDRPYMREAQRPGHSLIKILIVANVTVFVLQLLLQGAFPTDLLALSSSGFLFKPWTLVTYSFLHSTGQLFHIVVNMLMLYFMGKNLEQILNPRQLGTLLGLYTCWMHRLVGCQLGTSWPTTHGGLGRRNWISRLFLSEPS